MCQDGSALVVDLDEANTETSLEHTDESLHSSSCRFQHCVFDDGGVDRGPDDELA